jgi:hypothetical protein
MANQVMKAMRSLVQAVDSRALIFCGLFLLSLIYSKTDRQDRRAQRGGRERDQEDRREQRGGWGGPQGQRD